MYPAGPHKLLWATMFSKDSKLIARLRLCYVPMAAPLLSALLKSQHGQRAPRDYLAHAHTTLRLHRWQQFWRVKFTASPFSLCWEKTCTAHASYRRSKNRRGYREASSVGGREECTRCHFNCLKRGAVCAKIGRPNPLTPCWAIN